MSDSQICQFITLNPAIPAFKGLIKIHKRYAPIRPVINWRNAPVYNAAKFFNKRFTFVHFTPHLFQRKECFYSYWGFTGMPVGENIGLVSLETMVLPMG